MKRILPLSLILIAALFLAACGSSARSESTPDFYSGGAPMAPEVMPEAAYDAVITANESAGSGVTAAQMERVVIQNADLVIVVSDVEGRMNDIQAMARQMGGFVVSSNLYSSYTSNSVEVPEAQIVIRVPVEKLEDALGQIKADIVDVQSENRTGQDVTAEYVDLKSRLKNLEKAEAQLDAILEKATDTEDVVSIFNQLVYYREQIELVKGQIKYYDEAAALSAISVRIIAEETVQPLVIGKWEPKGVALEAIQDLVDFLKGFVEFLIRFTLSTLPKLILIGTPLYFIFIGFRALLMRGPKVKKEETPVEKK